MDRKIGYWSFAVLIILTLVLGWATWDEHIYDSEHAYSLFYNSIWFTLLWVLLATLGCYYITVMSLHRRISVFLLHIAFLVILSGALLTRLTGKTGTVHLRENHSVSTFVDESTRTRVLLPFSLSLKSFDIKYYPGTASPADYVSMVSVKDRKTGDTFEQEISMNHILKVDKFRFYQSSFDEDMRGSILSVNHDPWGITVSYAGYYLMFLSMLLVLFDKRDRFRYLLKKLSAKTILITLFLGSSFAAYAGTPLMTKDSLTINKEQASQLGSVWTYYHGRICPVHTLANDFTIKLTGKNHYKYASGEQVLFGWLFFPHKWQYVPMFEVKSAELKKILNSPENACFADFFDDRKQYRLEPYRKQMYGSNKPEGWYKEAVKLDEKIQLVMMLQNGSLVNVFPLESGGQVLWYGPNTPLPDQTTRVDSLFIRHFFPLYFESIMNNNGADASMYIHKLSSFQQQKAGNVLPSETHLAVERFYNDLNIFSLLFKVCLTLGGLGLLFFIFNTMTSRSAPGVETAFYYLVCLIFIAVTFGLALRTYIGGRLPLSNGYETMLLVSWVSLLTGVITRRYSFLITVFSLLLAGFTLLVAHISSMSPRITPLVPVLQSPLLNIHVLTIMISYGLCGFMVLNSLTSFMVWFFGGKNIDKESYVLKMKETSELFMYPASFLLGSGIFIGAIWANVSWGRYWGWDPKEIWALITFMLMGITFHGKTLTWFRKPLFYHAFIIIIFLSVLMTYFGVNYILGGKHSYAG